MDKKFPWGILLSLVAIVVIALGGALLLYHILNEPPPFKAAAPAPKPLAAQATPAPVAAPADAEGFLVVHLRAAVEMSPDSGTPSFDFALDNRGFSQECPGKIVPLDFRAQGKDYWTQEEGAIAEADSVVCLPATSRAQTTPFLVEPSEARIVFEGDDEASSPAQTARSKAKALFISTGKSGYVLYAGGVTVKACAAECEAGAAAGVSVTRAARVLPEDRFVFSVPVGDAKTLSVASIVPVTQ